MDRLKAIMQFKKDEADAYIREWFKGQNSEDLLQYASALLDEMQSNNPHVSLRACFAMAAYINGWLKHSENEE